MDRKAQISVLKDVASEINSGGDLVMILKHLVFAACRHANWTLGSIMSIDAAHGYAHVMVRYDPTLIERTLPDRWELATSPSLIALKRNEPVYIRDVRESEEFPGYRREAFERDYRTVLVMPMNCSDFEGRPMVLSVVSRDIMEVPEEDLAFLGMIVHLGAIAIEREQRLEAERQAGDRLQKALKAHTSLLEHVLADGSVSSLSAMVGSLLPNPVVVVDFTANQIIAGRSPSEVQFDDAAWQSAAAGPLSRQLGKAARDTIERGGNSGATLFLDDGSSRLNLAARIEPLTVDRQLVGALIIFSTSRAFSDLDQLLLDSAKFALSVQMMRSFIRFRFETRTQTELFFEVVERRWRDAADVQQRAQRLGINFMTTQQIVVVDFPESAKNLGGTSVDLHHSLARIMQQASVPACVVAIDGGLVCLIPNDEVWKQERTSKLMRRIAADLGQYFDEQPIVIASNACATLTDYPLAWDRCSRMIAIARSFGRTGALSGQDFGPLPMLVAAAGVDDVRAFVQESVGAIAAHDRQHGTPYLKTLSTYLREGCRSGACADAMGLHVTTLRYRLSRIQEMFGIDVETPERRFAIELAIHLHGVTEGRSSAEDQST
ncbi:MAG: PucR family transcriptional regulator [Mesorhizobium sp.]|uniref:helix-turn-helix domain-containing protein n=1 Tax=unclassified Mesorhizobium TaxID=325217 RepID=UPI000F7532DC|nr:MULTISPECIES: helix-turn-helix domain-containing protein [unclassified Mesorhizobium]AZO74350.1 PucR family transcriptional regulator [Mesorhizobium sp. M1D.F.Ca.ET.043.01.1.1]RWA96777.1 MAG: PucR family transcriptional regulator [Mesorhizobium sp.]RWE17785.1 MAG: PucR family transcriptional regulator [Mesorhizobium sp.]TJW86766.1 MAG: PucR family transcriptional regulator [Mesorhizobium sp.]